MTRDPAPASTDILCESCGYVLNGLPDSGNCPECGAPIARSTIESPRKSPAWERSEPGRGRTLWAALLSPGRFFRNLALHADTGRSRQFARLFLAIAALMNAKTILYHYLVTLSLGVPPPWLPPIWVLAILLVPVDFAFWWGTLELVCYLTTAEGRYWGLRMPRPIVRRALHYWTVHAAAASIVLSFVPLGYLLLVLGSRQFGLHMDWYLYTLSAAVVLTAFYLFKTYWIAMKAIMFGNPTAVTDPASAAVDPIGQHNAA